MDRRCHHHHRRRRRCHLLVLVFFPFPLIFFCGAISKLATTSRVDVTEFSNVHGWIFRFGQWNCAGPPLLLEAGVVVIGKSLIGREEIDGQKKNGCVRKRAAACSNRPGVTVYPSALLL